MRLRRSALRGFQIPGLPERLIVSLFVDDTTTFLAEDDDFDVLQSILDRWCIAARAKFNVTKTDFYLSARQPTANDSSAIEMAAHPFQTLFTSSLMVWLFGCWELG